MSSNVGSSGVYEAGDQRNESREEAQAKGPERFEEGKENSHKSTDAKDQRSIANRLADESKKDKKVSDDDFAQAMLEKEDPTAAARAHGNKPSRGAEIDKEILEEERAILEKKGDFGPAASN